MIANHLVSCPDDTVHFCHGVSPSFHTANSRLFSIVYIANFVLTPAENGGIRIGIRIAVLCC
jgi:hypothetical protein